MGDLTTRMTLTEDVSAKLQKISSAARNTATAMSNAGKAMDKAFSTSAPDAFASQAGSAMEYVSSAAEELGTAVDQIFSGASFDSRFVDDFADDFQEAAQSAEDFSEVVSQTGQRVDDLTQSTERLGESVDDIGDGGGLDDLAGSAEEAGESMEKAEGKAFSLSGALKKLFAVVSAAAIIGQVWGFVGDSISIGRDFTSMMSEVQAISGATESEIVQLEDTARSYGATTIFSATESAEALKYMSLAGWDANQSALALGGVLNLAAASGMGLGQSSDMVTDYLSAFGMEASQATYLADMLAFSQSKSNTTAEQLGEAYRNSAANMHAAGQDVETTTSLLEAMANQGYKGSEAGTALAAVMRDITQKMDDGAIKIGNTSIAVKDAQGNFRDLTDILIDVEAATNGMGDADKAAALGSTFTADSIKAMNMILTEGMDKVAGYEEALRHSGGTAEKMAGIMNDNLSGDLANMNSAFEEMKLQVYEGMEEPLRDGVQYITSDIIPALTDWVPEAFEGLASGAAKIGNAFKPLFETVLKNPEAIGKAFTAVGTGIAAFKGASMVSNIAGAVDGTTKLTGVLGNLSGVLTNNPWAVGAAAVTASAVAIGAAVEYYNGLQVEADLADHFGNIELDDIQIQDLAARIVPVDVTADLQLANVNFDEAESLLTQAEEALGATDYINWKVKNINVTLSGEDGAALIENTDTFVNSVTNALEKEEYAAALTVKALVGENSDSKQIVDTMKGWFNEDSAAMSNLSAAVTNMLEGSIEDGTYNVNTATAISILQAKMLDLVNGVKQSELQGKLDWLSITSSGAALESESWAGVVGQIGEYQTALMEADESGYQSLLAYVDQAVYNDPSRQGEADEIKKVVAEAYENLNTSSLLSGWDWMHGSLSDAYGDELGKAQGNLESSTGKWMDYFNQEIEYAANNKGVIDPMEVLDDIMTNSMNVEGGLDKSTRGALLDRYETMMPTIEEMQSIIDIAAENGEAVSEEVMQAYNQAMEIGAAGGDQDAIYAVMANELKGQFGNFDNFSSVLEEAGLSTENFSPEFQKAVDRAFTETVESTDYSALTSAITEAISGEEVDWSVVQKLLSEHGYEINLDEVEVTAGGEPDISEVAKTLEGLESIGTTTINGEAVVEYEVTAGQTMSEIAANAGIALDEFISANPQIENPNVINIGKKIYIPASAVEVDASEVTNSVSEQTQEAVESAGTGSATTEAEVITDTTVTAGETDTSGYREEVQNDLESMETWETDGTANVTLDQENNSDEVYNTVGNELRTAFVTPYSIPGRANVAITVDYSIVNPSASISIGGDGSGSGTVTASIVGHADGGYFDEPHMALVAEGGFGEYIIPMDGSDRSKEMWEDAGRMLGIDSQKGATQPAVNATQGAGQPIGNASAERTININLNGNGSIKISGVVSKEQIVDVMIENLREVFMNIVQQEIIEEGVGVYDY